MPIKFCSEIIFSGLRFFNDPEISDSGLPASGPSWRTCTQDFYVLKISIDHSRIRRDTIHVKFLPSLGTLIRTAITGTVINPL